MRYGYASALVFVRTVGYLEYAAGGGSGGLQFCGYARYVVERLCELVGVGEESGKSAERKLRSDMLRPASVNAADDEHASDDRHDRVNYIIDYAADGIDERSGKLRAQSAFEQFFIYLCEFRFAFRDAAVRAKHARAGQMLFGESAHFFHILALPRKRNAVALGYRRRYESGYGREQHYERRYRPVHDVHAYYRHQQRYQSRGKLHNALVHSVRKIFAERCHARHEIAAAVLFDFGKGNGEQFVVKLPSYVHNGYERQLAEQNIARPHSYAAGCDARADNHAVARYAGEIGCAFRREVDRFARKHGSKQ